MSPQPAIPRLDAATTVNEVVLRHPATLSVFDAFGVDACCGGSVSLEEAALLGGVPLNALLTALDDAITPEGRAP